MRQTFRKQESLRGRGAFRDVYTRGERIEGKFVRCFVIKANTAASPDSPRVVIGTSVSRTVKSAVERNRIKRFVRESYRTHKSILYGTAEHRSSSMKILFVFPARRSDTGRRPSYREIESDIVQIIGAIDTLNDG